jgi:hypothetical protein
MALSSYPSLYTLGHAAVANIFDDEVIVEEKVDGSQISFGLLNGELQMRSKGAPINVVAPEGMFAKAVEYVTSIQDRLRPNTIYRGEYLAKPKHVLCYSRTPANFIVIFDVTPSIETYLSPEEKAAAAAEIGLEVVPTLFRGRINSPADLRALLERESFLGGQKIEGVVIKPANYDLFGRDKKCVFAKFVSEEFKEVHAKTWTAEHGTKGGKDIIALIGTQYTTQARWQKALIHLEEAGKLEHSPRDIGLLIREVPPDIEKECADEIKQALWEWAWPQIKRQVIRGLSEWYKERLLKRQFAVDNSVVVDALSPDARLEP